MQAEDCEMNLQYAQANLRLLYMKVSTVACLAWTVEVNVATVFLLIGSCNLNSNRRPPNFVENEGLNPVALGRLDNFLHFREAMDYYSRGCSSKKRESGALAEDGGRCEDGRRCYFH